MRNKTCYKIFNTSERIQNSIILHSIILLYVFMFKQISSKTDQLPDYVVRIRLYHSKRIEDENFRLKPFIFNWTISLIVGPLVRIGSVGNSISLNNRGSPAIFDWRFLFEIPDIMKIIFSATTYIHWSNKNTRSIRPTNFSTNFYVDFWHNYGPTFTDNHFWCAQNHGWHVLIGFSVWDFI